ncbi:hypothetical protein HYH03_012985 [Edaphochlamys debaryana]|uniref:Fungal lipase-type domain-containing protein n=1 Tax=Edaphochlamys debaryana TaxID=47281 RepID=A0A835XX54_9CHLO|nr:hypothetical protein HYH03_012985 [Edaphochlamys debaryana]|eukprot:KAG2488480.1 hypothetical protein HYH03_012985 [Edaphochlamys debaryana]
MPLDPSLTSALPTRSIVNSTSSSCYWTGCSLGGCPAYQAEVDSSWCGFYDEYCCPIVSTCRTNLTCTNDATKVDPIGGVLSSVGIFNAAATSDNATNAYIMALLSNFAYPSSVNTASASAFTTDFKAKILPRLGGTNVTTIWDATYDLEVIVIETHAAVIVVFSGSESVTDWYTNLQSAVSTVSTTDFSSAPVSIASGFFKGYNASRNALMALVNAKLGTKKLWFAGHSLGGAYATLFAARAQKTGLAVAGVYTYGQPAVGNAAFVTAYNALSGLASRTYRYVVSGDPVPGLPAGFVHVVPVTVTLNACARRLLSEQASVLAPHEAARLEAEVAAEEGRADLGQALVETNRRMLGTLVGSLVPHGILDNYAYYIHTCRLSPADRSSKVPLLTSITRWNLAA